MKTKLLPLLLGQEPSPQRVHLRSKIERMIRLLRDALGGGVELELASALKTLAQHGDEIQRAVVIAIELIQLLAQGAERRYPEGHGRLKKAQVKAAIRYLLRAERADIPKVPDYLEPLFIDVAVDWSIDLVVLITNQHGLWDVREPAPFSARAVLVLALRRLAELTRPLWLLAVSVLAWILEATQNRATLTPEIRQALDRAASEGLISKKRALVGEVPAALVWLGDHREQVTAAFQLVFEAVQEAESFLTMTGPEKKAYARDLIMATLEELGFPVGGLFSMIVEAMIDGAIESAVNLFNKFPTGSPVFKHRKKG